MRRQIGLLLMVFVAGLLASGCEVYERDINYRPPLSGLPGMESRARIAQVPEGYVDPGLVANDELIMENPDGSVMLISRTVSQLMAHIHRTLTEDEVDLFVQQVLSQATLREFYDHQQTGRDAFDRLKKDSNDIQALFSYMPMGEYSPTVIRKPIGPGMMRVVVSGLGTQKLKWNAMDVIMEHGHWKLLWFSNTRRDNR